MTDLCAYVYVCVWNGAYCELLALCVAHCRFGYQFYTKAQLFDRISFQLFCAIEMHSQHICSPFFQGENFPFAAQWIQRACIELEHYIWYYFTFHLIVRFSFLRDGIHWYIRFTQSVMQFIYVYNVHVQLYSNQTMISIILRIWESSCDWVKFFACLNK